MATPPPPERARTPQSPLHGPMFDSPRRSSRIHNKQKLSPGDLGDSSPTASSRKRATTRPTGQAPSPPSSPISPNQRTHSSMRKHSHHISQPQTSTKSANAARLGVDQATKMYPTPTKTPRKRAPRTNLGNAARVLFHDRESKPEEIMPTPSKSKSGKKHIAFSLESFEEDSRNRNKVQIYTDSRERMPEAQDELDDDNPFVVKKGASRPAANGNSSTAKRARGRPKYGMNKEVDEAVEKDKGIVYTFRGRKVFRKFDDTSEDELARDDLDPAAAFSDQDMVKHQAGAEATKRMTRSSIKPRLLFPPKESELEQSDADDDTEEATTDIETLISGHEHPGTPQFASQSTVGIGTPPETAEKSKRSPFDSWPRMKPGRGSSGGTKRSGSPLQKTTTSEKRSRSAQPARS